MSSGLDSGRGWEVGMEKSAGLLELLLVCK